MVINMSWEASRRKGHDFELRTRLTEDGNRWKMSLWYRIRPEIGDFLIFGFTECNINIGYIDRVTFTGIKDIYLVEVNLRRGDAAYMEYKNYVIKRIRKIPKAISVS